MSKELDEKIMEAIQVRGIASSILNMSLPTFEALGNLLKLEGYLLIHQKQTTNDESVNKV